MTSSSLDSDGSDFLDATVVISIEQWIAWFVK
jgi:hypothetical protein